MNIMAALSVRRGLLLSSVRTDMLAGDADGGHLDGVVALRIDGNTINEKPSTSQSEGENNLSTNQGERLKGQKHDGALERDRRRRCIRHLSRAARQARKKYRRGAARKSAKTSA